MGINMISWCSNSLDHVTTTREGTALVFGDFRSFQHTSLQSNMGGDPGGGGGGGRGGGGGHVPQIFFVEGTAMEVSHPIISPGHIHFMGRWLLHAPVLYALEYTKSSTHFQKFPRIHKRHRVQLVSASPL